MIIRKSVISGMLMCILPVGFVFAANNNGKDIATILNKRYEKVISECDGKPAYYCSGIIIRINEGAGVPTWQPYNDKMLETLQFSYLRKDMTFHEGAIWKYDAENYPAYGIVLDERQSGNYSTRCFFPLDAMSWARKPYGCSEPTLMHEKGDEDNSTCQSEGINSAEEWLEKFAYIAMMKACSFSTQNTKYFSEAVKASVLALTEYEIKDNNEMLVNTSEGLWSITDPSKDNIQALWYKLGDKKGLDGAQKEQKVYFTLTEKWIPVISLTRVNNDAVFDYSNDDQNIKSPK